MQLHVDSLVVDYVAGRRLSVRALDGVSMQVAQGESVAIMGPGGSGKSTLALALRGLVPRVRGVVTCAPTEAADLMPKVVPLALVLQRPESALFGETVEQDVAFGAQIAGIAPEAVPAAVTRALALVGMDASWGSRNPLAMSGGEQRRVAIAGALAAAPRILVLDEPTAGLDPESHALVLEAIARLSGEGITTITVTHDPEDAARVARRLVVLNSGRIVWDGPTLAALTTPELVHQLGIGTTAAAELCLALAQRAGVAMPATLDERELAAFAARACGVRHA